MYTPLFISNPSQTLSTEWCKQMSHWAKSPPTQQLGSLLHVPIQAELGLHSLCASSSKFTDKAGYVAPATNQTRTYCLWALLIHTLFYLVIFAFLSLSLHCWSTTMCPTDVTSHVSLCNHSCVMHHLCIIGPASLSWWSDGYDSHVYISFLSYLMCPCHGPTNHESSWCAVRHLL